MVRQTVYDSLNILQRRRLHLAVAEALVKLGQGPTNPGEVAFHYGQAGGSHRLDVAQYSVLAGEKLLHAYGFRQAVDTFQRALSLVGGPAGRPAGARPAALCRAWASPTRISSTRRGWWRPTAACRAGRAATAIGNSSWPPTAG